jgi:hypothetical protein
MAACGFGEKEPQINADERRYHLNREAFEFGYIKGISQKFQKIQSLLILYFSFFASSTIGCIKIRHGSISAFICVHLRLINLKEPFQVPDKIGTLMEGLEWWKK